jgi:hypothetical protein
MMQTISNHPGDAVNEERSNNSAVNRSNWDEVMRSSKLRKVESLHSKLELAMLVASMCPHDAA